MILAHVSFFNHVHDGALSFGAVSLWALVTLGAWSVYFIIAHRQKATLKGVKCPATQ